MIVITLTLIQDEDEASNFSAASREDCAKRGKDEVSLENRPLSTSAFYHCHNVIMFTLKQDKEAVPNLSPVSPKKCISGKKRKTNEVNYNSCMSCRAWFVFVTCHSISRTVNKLFSSFCHYSCT